MTKNDPCEKQFGGLKQKRREKWADMKGQMVRINQKKHGLMVKEGKKKYFLPFDFLTPKKGEKKWNKTQYLKLEKYRYES